MPAPPAGVSKQAPRRARAGSPLKPGLVMAGIGRKLGTFSLDQAHRPRLIAGEVPTRPRANQSAYPRRIEGAEMTPDQNRLAVRRLVDEGFNKHNLRIFAKDAVNHDPAQPNLGRGPQGARESMHVYTTAFPAARLIIEREIA